MRVSLQAIKLTTAKTRNFEACSVPPVYGPGSERQSPLLLFVVKAMFNLSVKHKKRGPFAPAFRDYCAVKVQQTSLKLLAIFVNTDTVVLGNTDTEYRTDIKKYWKNTEYWYRLE